MDRQRKSRPGHWPAGSSLRAESRPPPEIFSLPGRYMRTGHSARTHLGRSSLGVRFAEAPAAGLLEITARNCRLASAARAARTDPRRGTPDSPDAGECDRRLAD